MNKFYIFLGNRSGNIFFLKKMFKNQIEAYFNKQGIAIKNLDVRQTQGIKYHAFLTLVFKSAQECYDYFGNIRNSVNKYLVINDEWKIYEFVHKENRKHDLGFIKHEPDERDEIVGNVCDEEESVSKESYDKDSTEEESSEKDNSEKDLSEGDSLDRESSEKDLYDSESSEEESCEEDDSIESEEDDSIESEEEKEDVSEYEKIYNWLVTPDAEDHRKQIEEIKSLCKWLATPYWERT